MDHEADLFIEELLQEITTTNNYNNKILFNIILDDRPNAFINQDNILHISTGLFKYSSSYEAILGVLAHEVGHLQKNHIFKRKDSLKKIRGFNNLTNLSIIAGTLITKSSSDQIAEALITNQVGIKNYYQAFSRDQEREADIYAIETLNKLNLSHIPLVKLLNLLEKESKKQGMTDDHHKFSSHPIYRERYEIINNNKIEKNYYFDKSKNEKFNFIKAKFFGFTEENNLPANHNLSGDYKKYANSIMISKQGRLKEALQILNIIIENNNNNIFLLETKADILYSNAFLNESLLFYEKVLYQNKKNYYVTKRVFDIKFILMQIQKNQNSKELLDTYCFLLEIFLNDNELKDKFTILAKNSNSQDWIDFFLIEDNFQNKIIDIKKYKDDIINIKKNSNNKKLIKIINYKLEKV